MQVGVRPDGIFGQLEIELPTSPSDFSYAAGDDIARPWRAWTADGGLLNDGAGGRTLGPLGRTLDARYPRLDAALDTRPFLAARAVVPFAAARPASRARAAAPECEPMELDALRIDGSPAGATCADGRGQAELDAWKRDLIAHALDVADMFGPSPPGAELEVDPAAAGGAPRYRVRESSLAHAQATSVSSSSATRLPDAAADFVYGRSENRPFLPGGHRPESAPAPASAPMPAYSLSAAAAAAMDDPLAVLSGPPDQLMSVVPGLHAQVLFDADGDVVTAGDVVLPAEEDAPQADAAVREEAGTVVAESTPCDVTLSAHALYEDASVDALGAASDSRGADAAAVVADAATAVDPLSLAVDELMGDARETRGSAAPGPETVRSDWAVVERLDVRNFPALVPEMAMEFAFELDVFQKEAIVPPGAQRECVCGCAHERR
jgi:hypothetical protein